MPWRLSKVFSLLLLLCNALELTVFHLRRILKALNQLPLSHCFEG